MSLQTCCCAEECTSDYRKFAPCDPNLTTTPIVILKTKFDECGFGSGVYSLTSNPICSDKYCGTWVCDNSITDDSDFCTNGNPTPCDCSTEDVYYLLRPSDNPCTLFTLLSYIDELKDGTCCDIRCPDRSSGCDSGPASQCFGSEQVKGCICTTADDLAWDLEVKWIPTSDNGSQSSNRDYGTAGGGIVFDNWTSNVAMNLTSATATPLSFTTCSGSSSVKEYVYKVVLNWQGSVDMPKFPGYFDDGGQNGYVCEDAQGNETRVQSYSINELWSTTFTLTLGVSEVTNAPAYMYWGFANTADKVDSGAPTFTCFGGSGNGNLYGKARIADAFSDFGNPNTGSNVVSGPANIAAEPGYTSGLSVCAGLEDTMYLTKTMPLGFPGLQLDGGGYGYNASYDAGELRIELALAVPSTVNCP